MAVAWIKLSHAGGYPVWVNMDVAVLVQPIGSGDNAGTAIVLPSTDPTRIVVKESPETVFEMWKAKRP